MDKLPVVDGRVRCPDQHAWIDVERCLACAALKSVEGGRRPSLLTCVSAHSRRSAGLATGSVGSFADLATLP